MCIQVGSFETGVLGIILRKHIEANDQQTNRQAHLGSSESNPVAFLHRLVHILDQRGQFGVIGGYILRNFAQYGLSVNVNR